MGLCIFLVLAMKMKMAQTAIVNAFVVDQLSAAAHPHELYHACTFLWWNAFF
jgi:hypothetical protein